MEQNDYNGQNVHGQTTVVVNQQGGRSNGLGTAGFVLAILGAIFCWVPILNFILLILGLIFSFVGIFKVPRGLAIAGLVISALFFIAAIAFIGALGAAIAAL